MYIISDFMVTEKPLEKDRRKKKSLSPAYYGATLLASGTAIALGLPKIKKYK